MKSDRSRISGLVPRIMLSNHDTCRRNPKTSVADLGLDRRTDWGSKAVIEHRARHRTDETLPPPASPASATHASPRTQLRVVIAEDEGWYLEGMANRLASHGVVVRKVAEPKDISSAVGAFRPHVLVLDDYFSRQRIGSESIIPKIMSKYPGVRFIVTTKDNSPDYWRAGEARVWGASSVLSKDSVLEGDNLWRSVVAAGLRGSQGA